MFRYEVVLLVGFVVVAAAVIGLGVVRERSPSPSAVDEAVLGNDPSTRPGDASVYARIEGSLDCVGLQREYDVAMGNWVRLGGVAAEVPASYANAAGARMRELGCYG